MKEYEKVEDVELYNELPVVYRMLLDELDNKLAVSAFVRYLHYYEVTRICDELSLSRYKVKKYIKGVCYLI